LPSPEVESYIPVLLPEMPDSRALLPFLEEIDKARHYTNFGPLERRLRGSLAELIDPDNRPAIVTLSNATVGLEMVLESFDLPAGSVVCIPAFTFAATASAIVRCGHSVLVADVDPDTWLLTPSIARKVLEDHAVHAFMPVATFGHPVDEAAWDSFSTETGCHVVIDAAAALGSQRPGLHCAAVYSLHATKALGAGEGGVLAVRDEEISKKILDRTNFGFDISLNDRMVHGHRGTNGKLSEYHAAVALAALSQFNQRLVWRYELEAKYRHDFANMDSRVTLQAPHHPSVPNYMNVRIPSNHCSQRVQASLEAKGIGTRRWYLPLIHKHPAFADAAVAHPLAVCDSLEADLIGLPFHIDLTHNDVERVAAELDNILRTS